MVLNQHAYSTCTMVKWPNPLCKHIVIFLNFFFIYYFFGKMHTADLFWVLARFNLHLYFYFTIEVKCCICVDKSFIIWWIVFSNQGLRSHMFYYYRIEYVPLTVASMCYKCHFTHLVPFDLTWQICLCRLYILVICNVSCYFRENMPYDHTHRLYKCTRAKVGLQQR